MPDSVYDRLVAVPHDIHNRLKQMAVRQGVPMRELTSAALRQYLDREDEQIAKQEREEQERERRQKEEHARHLEEVMRRSGMDRFKGWKPRQAAESVK